MQKLKLKPNNEGRIDDYYLLLFYRPDEKISRVDKFSINMFWTTYDKDSNKITRMEHSFTLPDMAWKKSMITDMKNITQKKDN